MTWKSPRLIFDIVLSLWKVLAQVTSEFSMQKKNQCMCMRKDAYRFHGHEHHFHKKFWQLLGQLHGLDNQSDGARSVGRTTPVMCWASVVWFCHVGMTFPYVSVKDRATVRTPWMLMAWMKLQVSSSTCTWYFFCKLKRLVHGNLSGADFEASKTNEFSHIF